MLRKGLPAEEGTVLPINGIPDVVGHVRGGACPHPYSTQTQLVLSPRNINSTEHPAADITLPVVVMAHGDYGTVELNSHRVIVACGDLDDAAGEILVFPWVSRCYPIPRKCYPSLKTSKYSLIRIDISLENATITNTSFVIKLTNRFLPAKVFLEGECDFMERRGISNG